MARWLALCPDSKQLNNMRIVSYAVWIIERSMLCCQGEILVVTKSSVRPHVHPFMLGNVTSMHHLCDISVKWLKCHTYQLRVQVQEEFGILVCFFLMINYCRRHFFKHLTRAFLLALANHIVLFSLGSRVIAVLNKGPSNARGGGGEDFSHIFSGTHHVSTPGETHTEVSKVSRLHLWVNIIFNLHPKHYKHITVNCPL